MSKFKFAFGLHNHQPVGNFNAVFDSAHEQSYLPFMKLIKQFPSIRFSLHQSGILWNWQKQAKPDYFQIIGELADQGRLELMTGGFYEPILTSIPERDAIGQIQRLSKYLSEHFEASSQGLWLTERIWEPHLPKLLVAAGVKYLPVDDTHFIYAGLEESELTGPFVTEHEGHAVTLLPIQKKLRYLIPFGKVSEVIDELKRQADNNPDGLAVYADDGEKFGVWPKTYEHCYEDGWLQDFFEALEQNSDWLQVVTLGEAAKLPPVGRVYLPSASYAEMLHWSLPTPAFIEYERLENILKETKLADKYGRFVRGGHWRGFLRKYEESNLMHKKMLAVSDRLDRLKETETDHNIELATDYLYAGQCNCPYWHGVFGGLYLPHIRQAIWQNLIQATAELDEFEKPKFPSIENIDFDYDGNKDVVVETKQFSAVLKPSRGGSLINLSLKKYAFDITDTLTRRKEGYHHKLDIAVLDGEPSEGSNSIHDLVITKEKGLKDLLVEDWYQKNCFIDHFLTDDVDLEKFATGKFGEEGDFVLEPYKIKTSKNNSVKLERKGHIWRADGVINITVQKNFQFDENSERIIVSYELISTDGIPVDINFAVENNFNFQAGHADDRFILVDNLRHKESWLDSTAQYEKIQSIAMIDQYRSLAIVLRSDLDSKLWHLPIFTVSLSEGGFEKVYQGTTFLNIFKLKLSSKPVRISFELFAGSSEEIPTELLNNHRVSHSSQ